MFRLNCECFICQFPFESNVFTNLFVIYPFASIDYTGNECTVAVIVLVFEVFWSKVVWD